MPPTRKRKHHEHEWQLHLPTTKKFALDRSEDTVGMWSLFESIVFVNIINKLTDLYIGESVQNIHTLYNEIVQFAYLPSCTLTIPDVFGHKTINQIWGKCEHYHKEKDLFNNL